jgi:hypothetical protein
MWTAVGKGGKQRNGGALLLSSPRAGEFHPRRDAGHPAPRQLQHLAGERRELDPAPMRFVIKQSNVETRYATSFVMAPWDSDPDPDLAIPDE